jgi:hypothetical protein
MHHIGGLSRRVSTISGSVPVCQDPHKTRPARSLMPETADCRKGRPRPDRILRDPSVPAPLP